MRILEFQPGAYRGLPEHPIHFVWNLDEQKESACSIRFLVGRNGTGKTNLLRFLTSIFLALDENYARPHADSPAYHVPFRLIYQLHDDIITIISKGEGRSGVQF